jgi:DNA-binding transcriptional MerR regulator
MDAAERLVEEIEPDRAYPHEFIVFKLTGYRSDRSTDPVMVDGADVRPDLVAVVQHLSQTIELPADYEGREALPIESVCRTLGVSTRTLQRYRREGLICHYVSGAGGHQLVCFADALDRFRQRHDTRLEQARRFTRIPASEQQRIVDEARSFARRGVSLNQAARELAGRHGRAHETIRGVLQRHDRDAATPIFPPGGPLTAEQRAVLHRAWRFGVPPAELARRFDRSAPAVHRAINQVRQHLLASLPLTWVDLATFERADAEQVILAAPAVIEGLDRDRLDPDVLAMVEAAHANVDQDPADADAEDALLAAFNLLKRRARNAVTTLPAAAGDAELDPIETDLRWASLLKRRLVGIALPFALRACEQFLHRRLDELPADAMLDGVSDALDLIADAIETVDPGRGQRLERVTSFAMDRALAARPVRAGDRAAARHQPGSVVIDVAMWHLSPWDDWLRPRPDLAMYLPRLDLESRRIVSGRYGWDGTPPLTLDALAVAHGTTRRAIGRAVWRAEAGLRELARGM